MKYEITQGQYVAFLNKLTNTQASTREVGASCARNGIIDTWPNFTTVYPYVAVNEFSWGDLAGYLDWAALRPMTELEFEKACRGDQTPVANEYAWGTTNVYPATGVSNLGLTNETASNAGANCANNNASNVAGPYRVGCFGQGVNTREGVGASYYGIMELSGNLFERFITVGNATGRAFTGNNGNGALDANGNADVSYWPNTTATGSGFRGGGWSTPSSYSRASDRSNAAYTSSSAYSLNYYGGRGVRLAP